MKNGFVFALSMLLLVECEALAQTQETWSKPAQISSGQGRSFYPAMGINKKGQIFVVWEERNQPGNEMLAQICMAEFDGTKWLEPVAVTEAGHMDWTPDIAIDTLGNPYIVWGEYLSSEIFCEHYDGSKWSAPLNVSQDSGESYYPRVAVDHSHRVHIVWHDNSRGGNWSVYYRCYDGSQLSQTFMVSDTLDYAIFPRIVIDKHDNLHVVWSSRQPPDDNRDVFYRTCTAGRWSQIWRITNDTLYSISPVIALSRADLPVVLWQQIVDYIPQPFAERIYWSTQNGETWAEPMSMENLSQSEKPSVTGDIDGNMDATWQLNTWIALTVYDSIMYSHFNGSAWSSPVNISGPIGKQKSVSSYITTDSQGNLHVVWMSFGNEWPIAPVVYYTHHSSVVEVRGNQPPMVPFNFSLMQNYPNPFNPSTVITYSVPTPSLVRLVVYDILGREITTLVNSKQLSGQHSVLFDARDITSGVYFYQLRANGEVATRKMLLVH